MTTDLHPLLICVEIPSSSRYSYRNWSLAFRCPDVQCGRVGRFNLNYLGRRRVACDGTRFVKLSEQSAAVLPPVAEMPS
jgi:hypothetical protein